MPAKEKAKTRSKQPAAVEAPARTGMAAAQAQMSGGGSRFPQLWLDDGDRARFHFLTNGDTDLVGTKFHRFGEDKKTRHYMCLRVFTGGEEECRWCEEGHDQVGSRFAIWVYCHNILHASQAEMPEDEEWEPTKVGKKTLFRQEIKAPKIIRMAAGKKQSWFSQFVNMWTTHGDLQLHIYELYREGLELETEYYLTTLKEQAIDPKLLDDDDIKELPTCEEVLREEVTFGPGGAGSGGAMGTDGVTGTDSDPLPSASAEEKEEPAVAKEGIAAKESESSGEPAADDNLI